MLLPLHAPHPLDAPRTPAGTDAPVRLRDCTGAVLLFAVAMVAALLALGTDWHALLDADRPLPESSRMMVLPPLPR